jgi:hypothetical protein
MTSGISYSEIQVSRCIMASETSNKSFVASFANSRSTLIKHARLNNWTNEKLNCYLWMFRRCLISMQRISELSVEDRTDDNIRKCWRKK